MTTNGGRLSAVARRRLLREAQPSSGTRIGLDTITSNSNSGASSPAQTPAPSTIAEEPQTVIQSVSRRDVPTTEEDDIAVASQNQFTPLVDASAVTFSSTREIENVGQTALKIRLERGQKCYVLGIYDIWVKAGTVSIYGGTLRASSTAYRVYAPSSHALPSIEACERHTEFQLESVSNDDGLRDLPHIGVRDAWTPTANLEQSNMSFYVIGYSFEYDVNAKGTRRLKELNLEPWKHYLASSVNSRTRASTLARQSRILLCGKRSSGLSTFLRCLTNQVLDGRFSVHDGNRNLQSVSIVDLDTRMPEFAPPGMISLVLLHKPIFGPSYTHLLPMSGSSSRILKMHFLGDVEATELRDWHADRILDLLDIEEHMRRGSRNALTIILAPKWLNDVDQSLASKMWVRMAPTDVVCFDASAASPHLRPWKALAESSNCRIDQFPTQVFDGLSPAREHDLQMQSYFHSVQFGSDFLLWDARPILAGLANEVSLSYKRNEAQVCAIILLGGHVALEDTYDALEGSIVAIVAVRLEANSELIGEQEEEIEDRDSDSNGLPTGDRHILPGVARTAEDLPRVLGGDQAFPVPAMQSECLGLGLVARIDICQRRIVVMTGLTTDGLDRRMQGQRMALVVQKATSDGRYRTDWVRREIQNAGRRSADPKV